VIPVTPHAAATPESAVHRASDPDRQPAHAAFEGPRLVRFHQQVHVIGLDAELEDPERGATSRGQRGAHSFEEIVPSERGEVRGCTERHVDRTVAIVDPTTPMRHGAATLRPLATGTLPATAPGSNLQVELRHLIRADNTTN